MVIKKKTVLVIDDDHDFSYFIKTILEAKGMSVIDVTSITEARIILEKEAPNIILLDMELHNEHGNDFLEERATNNIWAKIPVIVCSSQSLSNVIKTAIRFGADDYLLKPVKQTWLIQRIRKILINEENLPYYFERELEIELIIEAKPVSISQKSFMARASIGFEKEVLLTASLQVPSGEDIQNGFKSEEKSRFNTRGVFDTIFKIIDDTENQQNLILKNLRSSE